MKGQAGNTWISSEEEEQHALIEWAEKQKAAWPVLALLYHVPNGGKRSAAESARFTAAGVKAGVPDLCLPIARHGYHGLYIEMKRREGGVVSRAQSWWLAKLVDQGYRCAVCRGWEEARAEIAQYIWDGTEGVEDRCVH